MIATVTLRPQETRALASSFSDPLRRPFSLTDWSHGLDIQYPRHLEAFVVLVIVRDRVQSYSMEHSRPTR